MKDIKFRAWHKHDKRMMFRGLFDRNWYTESKVGKCIDGIHPSDKNNVEIMQYTGLKDVNNVEIYEGDIIPFENYKLECIIAEDGVWFENDKLTFRYDDLEKYGEPVKVIGNIYENPELLLC